MHARTATSCPSNLRSMRPTQGFCLPRDSSLKGIPPTSCTDRSPGGGAEDEGSTRASACWNEFSERGHPTRRSTLADAEVSQPGSTYAPTRLANSERSTCSGKHSNADGPKEGYRPANYYGAVLHVYVRRWHAAMMIIQWDSM